MTETKHIAITISTGIMGEDYNAIIPISYVSTADPVIDEENFKKEVQRFKDSLTFQYEVLESAEIAEELLHHGYWGEHENLKECIEALDMKNVPMIKTKKIAVTVDAGFSGGYYNEVVEVSYESDEDPIKEQDNFYREVDTVCRDIIRDSISAEYEIIDDDAVAERLQGTYWGGHENLEDVIEDIKQDIEDEEDTDEPM